MTRWARGHRKKHVDASSWEELQQSMSSRRTAIKEQTVKKSSQKSGLRREKDREARRKRRKNKKPCFNCRKPGHPLSECPMLKSDTPSGICFKCGSMEHVIKDCKAKVAKDHFPFAKCFICGQDGHISRNCPDNPRGLYPLGGGCAFCGSVEHFKKDCPENSAKSKEANTIKVAAIRKSDISSVDAELFTDDEDSEMEIKARLSKPRVVKF